MAADKASLGWWASEGTRVGRLRRIVLMPARLNLGYFFVEFGVYTVGAAGAAVYLLRRRADARDPRGAATDGYAGRSPAAANRECAAHTAPLFASPVLSGAIWADSCYGRSWGWDPNETWAFITGVPYSAFLHAQSSASWRGARVRWLALAGYGGFLFHLVGAHLTNTGQQSYADV